MNKNVIKHLGVYIIDLNINNKTTYLLFYRFIAIYIFIYQ